MGIYNEFDLIAAYRDVATPEQLQLLQQYREGNPYLVSDKKHIESARSTAPPRGATQKYVSQTLPASVASDATRCALTNQRNQVHSSHQYHTIDNSSIHAIDSMDANIIVPPSPSNESWNGSCIGNQAPALSTRPKLKSMQRVSSWLFKEPLEESNESNTPRSGGGSGGDGRGSSRSKMDTISHPTPVFNTSLQNKQREMILLTLYAAAKKSSSPQVATNPIKNITSSGDSCMYDVIHTTSLFQSFVKVLSGHHTKYQLSGFLASQSLLRSTASIPSHPTLQSLPMPAHRINIIPLVVFKLNGVNDVELCLLQLVTGFHLDHNHERIDIIFPSESIPVIPDVSSIHKTTSQYVPMMQMMCISIARFTLFEAIYMANNYLMDSQVYHIVRDHQTACIHMLIQCGLSFQRGLQQTSQTDLSSRVLSAPIAGLYKHDVKSSLQSCQEHLQLSTPIKEDNLSITSITMMDLANVSHIVPGRRAELVPSLLSHTVTDTPSSYQQLLTSFSPSMLFSIIEDQRIHDFICLSSLQRDSLVTDLNSLTSYAIQHL